MKPLKIVIAGYYGFGNLGDELICQCIVADFYKAQFPVNLFVLTRTPQSANSKGVTYVNRWDILAIFRTLWNADVFVLGGGGLIQDQTSVRSPYYYLSLCLMAKFFRRRIFTYALSIESLTNSLNRFFVKKIFHLCVDFFTVRDQSTVTFLAQMGISEDQIKCVPDPVLGYQIKKITHSHPLKKEKLMLFIPRFPSPSYGQKLFFSFPSKSIRFGLFHPDMEKDFFPTILKSQLIDLSGDMDLFASMDVVVSARFHGLVLATVYSIPFVGIGDFHKVGRFCEEWGFPFVSWNASIEELEKAISQARSLGANPLNKNKKLLFEQARNTASLIVSLVK